MLQQYSTVLVLINTFTVVFSNIYPFGLNSQNAITPKTYAVWRNATVPFYVDPQHFDHEQTLSILTALSMFSFKTCLKFKPVMARPASDEEVMVFLNPDGVRRCNIETRGHSVYNPHFVRLGYECLKSPNIDMVIMKALGFPFEHNRVTRDLYIDVLHENVEPGYNDLFTKEDTLPLELRFLPYDINSVMHFGNRDYSKNGHRTIIFKDHNVQQNRKGLTQTDLKKIEIVYGPECRLRDRQEKIQLCQSYPGVARKKREADLDAMDEELRKPDAVRRKRELDLEILVTKSLRVNPDITPPPEILAIDLTKTWKEFGIDEPLQVIIDEAHKISSIALENARAKYCEKNETIPELKEITRLSQNIPESDILNIIGVVTEYAKSVVDESVKNITKLCQEPRTAEVYQRARNGCNWGSKDPRCRETFRSTKFGVPMYSTNHRPVPSIWSTKHLGGESKKVMFARAMNSSRASDDGTTQPIRIKRDATVTTRQLVVQSNGIKNAEASERSETAAGNIKKDAGQIKTEVANDKKEVVVEKKAVADENKGEAVSEKMNAEGRKEDANVGGIVDDKTSLRNRSDRRSNRRKNNHRANGHDNPREPFVFDVSVEMENPMTNIHSEDINRNGKKHLNERKKGRKRPKEEIKHNVDMQQKMKRNENNREPQAKIMEPVSEPNIQNSNKEIIEKIMVQLGKSGPAGVQKGNAESKPMKKVKRLRQASPLPRTVPLSEKNEEFYKERRWPGGVLRYTIQEDNHYNIEDMRIRLNEVNRILRKKTCIRMKEVTREDAKNYEDYIVIDNSPDYVTGRTGGEQKFGSIEMFRGRQHRQHTAMMVMAMLGFYFEVSRHDRDKYIRVHMRHVRPDKLHHFEKIRSDATLPLPYDYASATHPAWQFWRQLGRTGISTVATYKDTDPHGTLMQSLGQNEKILSDLDIVKINSVYGVNCFHRVRAKVEPLQLSETTPMFTPRQTSGIGLQRNN